MLMSMSDSSVSSSQAHVFGENVEMRLTAGLLFSSLCLPILVDVVIAINIFVAAVSACDAACGTKPCCCA